MGFSYWMDSRRGEEKPALQSGCQQSTNAVLTHRIRWWVRRQTTVASLKIGETAKGDVSVISKEHQKETCQDYEEKGRIIDL